MKKRVELDEVTLTEILLKAATSGFTVALFPHVEASSGFVIASPDLVDELEEFLGMELKRYSIDETVYGGVLH
jgi:hypothetical protein